MGRTVATLLLNAERAIDVAHLTPGSYTLEGFDRANARVGVVRFVKE